MKYNPQNTDGGKPRPNNRRSIRLKGYDYSKMGAYFITICCQDRECRFGEIVGAGFTPAQNDDAQNAERATEIVAPAMELNEYGMIAYNEWIKLPERFLNIELDVFQIMPNHMHGIIVLKDVGATARVAPTSDAVARDTVAQNNVMNENVALAEKRAEVNPAPTNTTTNATVGDIVGAYKSLVANGCLDIHKQKWAGVNPAPYMGKLWQRNYYEHIIRNDQSFQTISNYIINNPAKWNDDKFFIK